jgi:hypothetical protein
MGLSDELERVAELHRQGVLSDAEFDAVTERLVAASGADAQRDADPAPPAGGWVWAWARRMAALACVVAALAAVIALALGVRWLVRGGRPDPVAVLVLLGCVLFGALLASRFFWFGVGVHERSQRLRESGRRRKHRKGAR